MTNVSSTFCKMCLCQILVLLCTCFAMSTKMAANCKPPIKAQLKLRHCSNWLGKIAGADKKRIKCTI